ncbi:hypothetical protein BY996DRAFT_4583859 [Phakopsora pachyrhizi]|uniref:SET domain-containing protein n=1 Tax=Phakopsora pachyrhizi TaxID=170000 RepID=A0AAV0B8L4_PHAPC|nr:hypothetical protein BY996DRAFT_4583859 [Phakopsora pachyrhizi]CAH7680957.1 hypothetical protein PPACK8108_LOCUS13485 [Phakopsora pachyrhizi]CAH7682849.1 hypothetical protein PPACK8108_LOCUS15992 [Phakopsora pachyrhizi]
MREFSNLSVLETNNFNGSRFKTIVESSKDKHDEFIQPSGKEKIYENLKEDFYPEEPIHFGKDFYLKSCHPDPEKNAEKIEPESYCIFLNSKVNQDQGMVVLSKPSNFIKTLETIDLIEDSERNGNDLSSAMKVVKMPMKGGMGALSLNRLDSGQELLDYRANVLISVEQDILNRSDIKFLRKLAIMNLPPSTQQSFLNLHGNLNWLEDQISSIIDLNSFEIKLGKDFELPFFAVMISPSRLNHDCRPNLAFFIENKTLKVHMRALRVISPGEELTISYRDTGIIREERQDELLKDYGFECKCAQCQMSKENQEESDRRIQAIEDLHQQLSENWYSENNDEDLRDQAEELIELYSLENLLSSSAEPHTLASLIYNSYGQTSKSKAHASKSISIGLTTSGPNWEDRKELLKLIEDPQSHWSHGIRLRS